MHASVLPLATIGAAALFDDGSLRMRGSHPALRAWSSRLRREVSGTASPTGCRPIALGIA